MPLCTCGKTQSRLNAGGLCKDCFNEANNGSEKLKDNEVRSDGDKGSNYDESISNTYTGDDSSWEKMERLIERKLEERFNDFESSIKDFNRGS